ncbi:hypothetical protein ABB37_02147 [Leptomonas pyrrhocoris]|uniref:Exocyst complex component Sec10-like alpha-helical bundle domain-containing protein n=1 Tax=Leptomonas pyrrhocoris TaxID=157538 RepID=A0A0M9G761_LEPPY|nr:hypothetical protein ABB37_02147 [Leptomonas pyrrhocoris]KPA84010.1 hypothetical protein ABB37_02147 [Leptomonas pyrrhocoris]|eukprot:XP_015662449.1 hypothetical protein ABB37_02147 [Leptomonas pyrrhocoris]
MDGGNGNGDRPSPRRRIIRRSTAARRQVDDDGVNGAPAAAAPGNGIAPSLRPSAVPRAPAPRIAGPSAASSAAGGGIVTPPSTAGSTPVPRSPAPAPVLGVAGAAAAAGDSPPAPPVNEAALVPLSSAAAAAMESAMANRRSLVDRTLFNAMTFSPPLFVNNVSQRLLYPTLQKYRAEQKKVMASSGPGGGGGDGSAGGGGGGGGLRADSEAARLLGSDGTSLFGSSHMPMSMRTRARGGGGDPDGKGGATIDYRALAGQLSSTLEEATEDVRRLLEEEELTLHREEVRCKRVEIQEKRRLATVRLGLEGTSARLQIYENRVSNAQAATAGIEQHLAQSNARVQRGKAVSQLLRYFKMMTTLSAGELRVLLDSISATRKLQRAAVTTRWASGRVSAFRPRFYTTAVNIAAVAASSNTSSAVSGGRQRRRNYPPSQPESASSRLAGAGTGAAATADEDAANKAVGTRQVGGEGTAAAAATGPSRPRVFRRGGRRAAASREASLMSGQQRRSRHPSLESADGGDAEVGHRAAETTPEATALMTDGVGGPAEDEEDEEDAEENNEDVDGDAIVDLSQVRMQRSEAAAVAAGLDRLFALRYSTEAQVEWCQRLTLLANELGDLAKNSKNVRLYVDWLRKELVSDLFHVVTCFNEFYDQRKATAVHQAYGRALLKTLGRISSLYNTLTSSNDELLTTFFKRSINELGLALFSEMSPKPLPSLPLLTQATDMRAMDFYKHNTDKELQKTFNFLTDRIKRDVIIVETIFGTTNTARQQLLSQVTDGVVNRFLSQQIKLASVVEDNMVKAEAALTPRTKRRCGVRVADAIAYHLTMETRLFSFYQQYMKELENTFSASEVEFLTRFVDVIFAGRASYGKLRTELNLLNRYFVLIEEKYTRNLHPIPDEFFDLREAHMAKMKDVMDRLAEVTTRVKTYALPTEVGAYVYELIKATLVYVGSYLDTELRKVLDSLRGDRDNWRVKPKSEDDLLRPPKPESQECALRMLLFAQSSLMSLNDSINVICVPLLRQHPRLMQNVEDARVSALESLDERSERVLNMCVQAILLRSLSILQHYQLKNDYLPKLDAKNAEADAVAPPCTRACTLFCYYVTRQLDMAKEFIRLSNGQLAQRQTASQLATDGAIGAAVQQHQQQQNLAARAAATEAVGRYGGAAGAAAGRPVGGPAFNSAPAAALSGVSAVRARARTMNLQQLLYGDGGPSSFVRTLGVCLYRGIAAHLKSFTANDRGALVYKQDVTAYKEAMGPLTNTPGLGGAVVEVLFQMLKETSSLLIMPLDHIKEVKESGTLRLMSAEEKLRYLRIRQDVRAAMKVISQ